MGSASTNPEKRRVVNACSRCRQHKIKCTGDCPCSNCKQRKVRCKFEGEETKVHITKKHFSSLKRRTLELEEENRALQQQLAALTTASTPVAERSTPSAASSGNEPAGNSESHGSGEDDNSSTMVNPLSCGPPKYITDSAGRPHYLGHTSSWSLTIRLLHLTHQALYKCPFPSAAHHVDTMTYSLPWNGLRSAIIADIRGLPSLDHALFLINATKFRTGRMFHLFDEDRFMSQLHQFYEASDQNLYTENVWFIHFLAIMALGKAFIGEKSCGTTPPGAEFFTRAFMMLPDYSFLWKDPCAAAEVLCSMALYLQSIDWRTSAHNLIGQALRILQVHGYHTNVSQVTDKKDLGRCQHVWWTVYVLERQMAVLMGVPSAINDSDITASLPIDPDSTARTMTVAIHVKLSRAFSQVVNALYRESSDLNSTLVKTTQEILQRLADVALELREYFPVPDQESLSGISRVSGYLNLLYHQCIMLAIRPFLFVPMPIQLLLQICLESARKTVLILSALHQQTLLEWFLPFDLESTVSACLVVTMAKVVCPSLVDNPAYFTERMFDILDHIIEKGNLIAADQKMELSELGRLCAELRASPAMGHYSHFSESHILPETPLLHQREPPSTSGDEAWTGLAEAADWARNMTPSQLLEVVDLLNGDDLLNWMEFADASLDVGDNVAVSGLQ
ncbi:fungal-specific transcription factor domain-containing protein [Aspergillus nidulans var. acristatus]